MRYVLFSILILSSATLARPLHAQVIREEPNLGGEIDTASKDVRVAQQRLRPSAGYEVNLFASEQEFPELANPISMTFDAQGRLWVITSPTYPHYFPGEQPRDKLVILTDTNGDGRADTLQVFADSLYIPMGFELGDGGAYVSQQPNLVFLKDTNGDGRADYREFLLHGFGSEDSHHSLSAFTWGPGGGLYFQEGTFHHSQVETPYGPVRVQDAGVFRYEPRTEKLSVFVSYNFANPWGHVVDRWGQNFISDASGGSNYWGTPFSGHVEYPNKQKPMREWTLTKVRPTAGIEFIRSRHFPDEAQGNFLITNVIGFHGIKQYRVIEDGSGFIGEEIEPLLQSSDINFRPVDLQFGPDGALYVVDWFNPLIGHMQYSLRDPRRDHSHGRIWRITYRGRSLLERREIQGQPIEAQLELLKAYEDRTRYRARLALREHSTEEVVDALQTWVADLDQSQSDYEHHLLEALWVHQHHDAVNIDLLKRLLGAEEFRARAAAVRVLHHWLDRVDEGMDLLAQMANDPEYRVRLEAVRALSFVPTEQSAEIALQAMRHPMDYYLEYVLDATVTTLEPVWKPALADGRPLAADHHDGLAYLLERLEPHELASAARSEPVYEALLTTAGVERPYREEALQGLADLRGASPESELVSAIYRLDGVPGGGPVISDLAQILLTREAGRLADVRAQIERLAREGMSDVTRQGAYATLMRIDGEAENAWALASQSVRGQTDAMKAAQNLSDDLLRQDLYRKIHTVLIDPVSAAAENEVSRRGAGARFVRIMVPGRNRSISLAEVQVYSGGRNVAVGGEATQSSIMSGGAIGGHAFRAIDGRTTADPAAQSTAFTDTETNPWWEVDLGSAHPVDSIQLWGGGGEIRGFNISVLGEERQPIWTQDDGPQPSPSLVFNLAGDPVGQLREAAIASSVHIPGRESEVFEVLADYIRRGESRSAALEALRSIPQDRWPSEPLEQLGTDLIAYARDVPPEERTGDRFLNVVSVGRGVADRLPPEEGSKMNSALDALEVRVIHIVAVEGQMRFDLDRFAVYAGQNVELVLVNDDHMPHNLLITAPGDLREVGEMADAMAAEPDGFEKQFIPDTPSVLFATRLINHAETDTLRFAAPDMPDDYPFVCTFPGHWLSMNGIMEVLRPEIVAAARE